MPDVQTMGEDSAAAELRDQMVNAVVSRSEDGRRPRWGHTKAAPAQVKRGGGAASVGNGRGRPVRG